MLHAHCVSIVTSSRPRPPCVRECEHASCGAQTGGRGVDMALNSLADDKLQATVRCLAPHGQLLEIGKYDILKNTPLGMRPLHNNISFQGIDLDSLFKGVMQDQARPSPSYCYACSRSPVARHLYVCLASCLRVIDIRLFSACQCFCKSAPVPNW